MKLGAVLVLSLALAGTSCTPGGAASEESLVRDRRPKMGTFFEIQIATPDREGAREAIDAAFAEIDRIEALLSEWRPSSEISAVNAAAGRSPVRVGPETIEVLSRSSQASRWTDGAFDATFAACGQLWSFREPRVPTETEIQECLPRVGWSRVIIDSDQATVFLPEPEMKIGIAGIGKGFGVDRAADVLLGRGLKDWMVDGGGDIRLSGGPDGHPWRVGIAHPRKPGALWGRLDLDSGAVVTSGDYESYFERDGVRYHHILDPATGRPSRGVAAVTVIAPDATSADALATGLMVLGPERGLALVEELSGIEALFIASDTGVTRSSGFPEIRDAGSSTGR